MRTFPLCLSLLALCLLTSCETIPSRAESPEVTHVVLVWLKNPGDAAVRQKLIETAETFESIPGVLDVDAGVVLPSKRAQVDSTYDVGVVIRFESEEALRAYESHPTHTKAVQEVLVPSMKKFKVYDIIETD
jgi:hypothetical protein